MSLSDEYSRQWKWRSWSTILDALPPFDGATVLDLGCATGDQSAELAARGARVIGVDANAELLAVARARGIVRAQFRELNLRDLGDPERQADGVWCSFAAAYFPDLSNVLIDWTRWMLPGSWIALTEIDDLFGHGPIPGFAVAALEAYCEESLRAGRYDFRMGRKLADHVTRAGLCVTDSFTVDDREFSQDGPVDEEVLEAWRCRFDRMRLLQEFCGADFGRVRDAFLDCLLRPDHWSSCRVHCCIATKPAAR